MKQRRMHRCVLLAGALSLTIGTAAPAQQPAANKPRLTATDVAATFSFERAQVAQTNGNRFWLKGGSLNGAVTFYKGFGLAANSTGEHASSIQSGVSLGKIAFMAGPRYTVDVMRRKPHHPELFAEWLFGGVHGFDSLFPGATGTTATASAFSTQAGGGINVHVARGFGLRLVELDYVHTSLPNNAANSQNDLRIAFGANYHFGTR